MAEKSTYAVAPPKWPLWWLLLSLIVLLAGGLRFWGLAEQEIWIDESCTSFVVGHWSDWPSDGPDPRTSIAHKPYFWALSLWTRAVGDDVWGLRSFSVLGGCLAVMGIGLLGGLISGPRVALLSLTLAAVNPLLIYYSQQARVYAWWIFFSAVWLICLQQAARSLRWRWWGASVLAAGACVFVHYHTLFFLPASAICVFISRRRAKAVTQWFFSYAALAVAMIPLVFNYVIPLRHQGPRQWLEQTWQASPPSLAIVKSLGVMLPSADYPNYLGSLGAVFRIAKQRWGEAGVYSMLLLPVVVMLAGLVCMVLIKPAKKENRVDDAFVAHSANQVAWLGGFAMVGLVSMAGYSALVFPAYIVGRYDLIVLPAMIVLCAIGLNALAVRCTRSIKTSACLAAIFLVIMMACSASVLAAQRMVQPGSDTHNRALRIANVVGENDMIVSLSMYRWFMDYEWRQIGFTPEIVSFPGCHDRQLCWDDAQAELAAPTILSNEVAKMTARIEQAISQGRRVWLLAQGAPEGPRWEVNRRLFSALREGHIDVELRDAWLGLAALKKTPGYSGF